MTFRSKVLACTSTSLEKPLFFGYFGQFDNFRSGGFDRNGQKAHIHSDLSFKPTPESVRLSVQKFWPVQKKYDGQTDGQTHGRTPQTYWPQPFGLGPKNYNKILSCVCKSGLYIATIVTFTIIIVTFIIIMT